MCTSTTSALLIERCDAKFKTTLFTCKVILIINAIEIYFLVLLEFNTSFFLLVADGLIIYKTPSAHHTTPIDIAKIDDANENFCGKSGL